MRPLPGPRRLPLLILAGLLLVIAGPAGLSAQQVDGQPAPGEVQTPADQEPAPPRAVLPPEIANRATEVVNRLREIRRLVMPTSDIQEIAESLPREIARIEEYGAAEVNRDPSRAAPKLLREARQQWGRFESDLMGRNQELDARSAQIAVARDEVARLAEIWRLTAEAPATQELPTAVRQQVQTVLAEIEATEAEIRGRQEYLLTLQNQISEQRIAIAETLEEIEVQLVMRQDDLLVVTVAPLWRADGDEAFAAQIRRDIVDTVRRVQEGLSEFVVQFRQKLLIHLGLFLLLFLVISLLRRRSESETEVEAEIEAARSLLRRPLAASGLVSTLVMAGTYVNAPLVMSSIIAIVALPFAAGLTPSLVPAPRRQGVYLALLLTLLINVQSLIVAQGALQQLMLVLIAVLGLGSLEMLRRCARAESPMVWPSITRATLIIGWPAFLVTLVAAVLGYLPLAEFLSGAALESAYGAYLLLAAVRVIDALVVLALRTSFVLRANSIRLNATGLRRRIERFVRVLAVSFWLLVTLRHLHVRNQVIAMVGDWLTRSWQLGSLRISLGAVLLFVLVLWFTTIVSRIVRSLLQDDILPRAEMGRGRSHMISMLVNYTIIGLGFLAALAAAGIDIEQFALIGGALGVGIGFGLQNIVSNFVSGLILVFERPVQVGDVVEVGPLMGTVRRIGIRSSTVRTFDEAEVIVPNSDLISSHVVNWTLSDQLRRMEVKVGVAYGTDPVKVQEILVEVAKAHEKVLEYPAPYALFRGFGDSSLDFVVRFWTSDFGDWIHIASQVTVGINAALKEAGVTIPFPQRDLHIYSVDPPAPIPDGGRVDLPVEPGSEPERRRPQADDA